MNLDTQETRVKREREKHSLPFASMMQLPFINLLEKLSWTQRAYLRICEANWLCTTLGSGAQHGNTIASGSLPLPASLTLPRLPWDLTSLTVHSANFTSNSIFPQIQTGVFSYQCGEMQWYAHRTFTPEVISSCVFKGLPFLYGRILLREESHSTSNNGSH